MARQSSAKARTAVQIRSGPLKKGLRSNPFLILLCYKRLPTLPELYMKNELKSADTNFGKVKILQ